MRSLLEKVRKPDYDQVKHNSVRSGELRDLPENLVLYSARYDFGIRVLQKTGNLAIPMRSSGILMLGSQCTTNTEP
jgi:hypothetical protein